MKITIRTKKEILVPQIVESEDIRKYAMNIYPVQYRNYPNNQVHIQGTTKQVNRSYGFAFNIPGQSKANDVTRTLYSKAGTGQLYWNGSLIVNGTTAALLGANGDVFDVPMTDWLMNELSYN